MAISHPDNGIGIVVYDDSDVLMSLSVAGLINTDAEKVVQPPGALRLKVMQASGDAASYRLPVDAHEV